MVLRMFRNLQRLVTFGAGLVTIVFVILNSYTQLDKPLLTNDFNAWMLPAVAPLNGWGMPFRDFWAIEPPALLLMTSLWALVSQSLAWFHVLSIVLQLGTVWLYWKVLHKVFPFWQGLLLYGFGILLYFNPAVQSMLLASEVNGLFFVMLGLYALLTPKTLMKQAFWASLAFGLAGQMKEVFAFSVLALVPLYLKASLTSWRLLLKTVSASIAGMGVMALIVGGYLVATNSVAAYREVLVSKSEAFGITNLHFQLTHAYQAMQAPVDRFMWLDYSLVVIGVLAIGFGWAAVVFSKELRIKKTAKTNLNLQLKLPSGLYGYGVLGCYWLGSWAGYIAQNRYGNKYDIAVLFATQIVIVMAVMVVTRGLLVMARNVFKVPVALTGTRAFFIIFTIISLAALVPEKVFLMTPYYQFQAFHTRSYLQRWQNLENPALLALETALKDRVPVNECVQGVYGWAIANLYVYSERVPCTRFFIPNIVTPSQVPEYQQALIARPPAAIRYASGGADLNIAEFEETVFPYSQVIADCYQPDDEIEHLYWPTAEVSNREQRAACIEATLVKTATLSAQKKDSN